MRGEGVKRGEGEEAGGKGRGREGGGTGREKERPVHTNVYTTCILPNLYMCLPLGIHLTALVVQIQYTSESYPDACALPIQTAELTTDHT